MQGAILSQNTRGQNGRDLLCYRGRASVGRWRSECACHHLPSLTRIYVLPHIVCVPHLSDQHRGLLCCK